MFDLSSWMKGLDRWERLELLTKLAQRCLPVAGVDPEALDEMTHDENVLCLTEYIEFFLPQKELLLGLIQWESDVLAGLHGMEMPESERVIYLRRLAGLDQAHAALRESA